MCEADAVIDLNVEKLKTTKGFVLLKLFTVKTQRRVYNQSVRKSAL